MFVQIFSSLCVCVRIYKMFFIFMIEFMRESMRFIFVLVCMQ